MDNILVQNKVKLLFEKISEPQYVMNNYYVDHFFIKINSNDPGKCILQTFKLIL